MVRALFVCSRNRLRSPTAEDTFGKWQGVETASAGTDEKAASPLDSETIEWAEIIFVMERSHRNRVAKKFGHNVRNKRLVVLDIPDEYEFMDPALVKVLERKVGPYLVRLGGKPPAQP